jgi:hypothetical protein
VSTYDTFQVTDTIASGASQGAGVSLNNGHVVGLVMPAGWDAAAITLSVAVDAAGASYGNAFDVNCAEVTIQAAAGRYIPISPSLLPGIGWLMVRSGTSGTPVNQTAARNLTWIVRKYS